MPVSQNVEPSKQEATHLSIEEMGNPMIVIKSVLTEINLGEVRKLFYNILEVCLTTDNYLFDEAEARYELFSILKKVEYLIEAASLL